jgi:hypothetical protein
MKPEHSVVKDGLRVGDFDATAGTRTIPGPLTRRG